MSESVNRYQVTILYEDLTYKTLQEEEIDQEFLVSYKNHIISDSLQKVDDEGKYQYLIFFFAIVLFFNIGIILNFFAYSFYEPNFECKDELGDYYSCSRQDACLLGKENYKVISERTSYITENEIYCGEERDNLMIYQSLMFLMNSFWAYLVVMLTDILGRKFGFKILFFTFSMIFIMGLYNNIFFLMTALFMTYTSIDISNQLCIIYYSEITSQRLRSKVTIFWFSFQIGGLFINIFSKYYTNYRVFFVFTIFPIFFIFYMKKKLIESPFQAFSTGKLLSYINSLKQIAKYNGKDDEKSVQDLKENLKIQKLIENQIDQDKIIEITIENHNNNLLLNLKDSLYSLLQRENFIKFINILIISFAVYANESILLQFPQKMGINNIGFTFISHLLIAMIADFLIFYFSEHIPRKFITIFVFSTLSIVGITTLFLRNFENDRKQGVFIFFLSCLDKFTVEMLYSILFIYISELFPTKLRGFAGGILVFFGRTTNSLGPIMIRLSEIYQVHSMFFGCLPCFLALFSAMMLPETLNKKLLN